MIRTLDHTAARVETEGTSSAPSAPATASAPSNTDSVIEVRRLTVSYGQRPVLRSISFDVPKGQLVGIVGPNGAGKSTLLRAILGQIRLDSGSVLIDGEPINGNRHRIAYVPQTEAVDWDFPVTVLDVVVMGRYPRLGWFGRPKRNDRQAAVEALDLVAMGDFANRHIRQLSGGQQQRVFLARALCQHADVMLLDEPFSGVDAATELAIFELIKRLTNEGKTLVVVNHDLSVLDRFDSVMLLNQRIVAMGPTSEVVNETNLRRTYGGRLTLLDRADAVLQNNRADS